jgi:RNA polymerase sigma-70 factor (ECF subfamily)
MSLGFSLRIWDFACPACHNADVLAVMHDSKENAGAPDDSQRYELFVKYLLDHEPAVRAFLRGLLPTWQDVEEVTQEASLVAWRKFSSFEEGTSFGGWFLTIARYQAMTYRRRLARNPLIFSNDLWDVLAEEAGQVEYLEIRRQNLERCLDELGENNRKLIMKVYEPGVVMREVAKQTGKSEQAFYKFVQRLRAVLLKCIAKAMEGA